MIVENAFTIAAPRERIFDALLDLERLVPCLPGARLDGVINGGSAATGQVRIPLGRSSVSYRFTLRVRAPNRDAGTVSLSVEAQEVRGSGRIISTIVLRLREIDGVTSASLRGTSDLTGRAATVDPDVLRRAATALLKRCATSLATVVGEPDRRAPRRREPDGEGLEAAIRALDDFERPPAPPIRGTVTVMTDEPIEMPVGTSVADTVTSAVHNHPWLVPAVLIGAIAAALLIRRRGD